MPIAIIEIILVFVLIVVVSLFQKDIKITEFFLNSSAFLITFGGTFAASILQFSSKEILNSVKFLKRVFLENQIYPKDMVNIVIELDRLLRERGREGLKVVKGEISHPILIKGIDLLSSEVDVDEFSDLLQVSIKSAYADLKKYERIFSDMGVYAPMFGLLGTLVGLIQLLRELSDPSTIAPNMAVALVTTLYGIALAGFIFLPVSGRIKTKSDIELINSQIIFDGVTMIRKGYGPIAIEQKLRAYL